MNCTKCNASLPETALFCSFCGASTSLKPKTMTADYRRKALAFGSNYLPKESKSITKNLSMVPFVHRDHTLPKMGYEMVAQKVTRKNKEGEIKLSDT